MTISIDFTLTDPAAPHGGLSRGDVTLEGEHGIVTSAGRTPDQSMILYIAIVDLLDGLSRLLTARSAREWEWIGNDSSFQVIFRRRDGSVAVEAMREPVGEAPERELASVVWHAVDDFISRHRLPPSDLVYDDLRSAFEEFHDRLLRQA
jgi:hypothetical protein